MLPSTSALVPCHRMLSLTVPGSLTLIISSRQLLYVLYNRRFSIRQICDRRNAECNLNCKFIYRHYFKINSSKALLTWQNKPTIAWNSLYGKKKGQSPIGSCCKLLQATCVILLLRELQVRWGKAKFRGVRLDEEMYDEVRLETIVWGQPR